MDAGLAGLDGLERRIHQLVNDQMQSDAYRRLFAVKLTKERYGLWVKERTPFVMNRRNCWAYVQANAPFDIKKLVWAHEEDELAGSEQRGVEDHPNLGIREGVEIGMSRAEIESWQPSDTSATCLDAWLYLASTSPWIEALAASAGAEMVNSDEVVKGGSAIRRMAEKLEREAGIPIAKQANNKEHMEVDIEHPKILMTACRKYALDAATQALVIRGVERALQIDRVWRGAIADAMARIPA